MRSYSIHLFLAALAITLLAFVSWQRESITHDLQVRVALAQEERDSATSREARLRDSAMQRDQERDAAWSMHVRDLQAMNQGQLQSMARAAAKRARTAVAAKGGVTLLAEASDTGSGRPPCLVSLTCSEAIAQMASDSLLRTRLDSSVTWSTVQAAACTTKVGEARVSSDSACLSTVSSLTPRASWWQSARTLTVAALICALAGAVAAN